MSESDDSTEAKVSAFLKKEQENQMKEWEKARELIKDYDNRLHDLRKFGFSFITGLLTIGSLVTQTIARGVTTNNIEITGESTEIIAGPFNLGVFIITIMLIVALHLFDKNYRVFQEAANTRIKVLERKLNLELSEAVTVRYETREKSGKGKILSSQKSLYLRSNILKKFSLPELRLLKSCRDSFYIFLS